MQSCFVPFAVLYASKSSFWNEGTTLSMPEIFLQNLSRALGVIAYRDVSPILFGQDFYDFRYFWVIKVFKPISDAFGY